MKQSIKGGYTWVAAINKKQKCVWGIGKTNQEALTDAKKQIKSKSADLQKKGLGKIEYATLKKKAPTEFCGIALFKHIVIKEDQENGQIDLFGQ